MGLKGSKELQSGRSLLSILFFLLFSKLLVTVSWTKPTWDHHKVHWNGEKGDQQTSQAQGKEK